MDGGSANASSTHGGDTSSAPPGLKPIYLLLLVFFPACFALNPVSARALADAFGPATLTLLRWSLSELVIGTLALMRPCAERWQAPLSHLLRLAVLAALGMGFCSIAAYVASRTTEATNTGNSAFGTSHPSGHARAALAAPPIPAGTAPPADDQS